jgi:transposase
MDLRRLRIVRAVERGSSIRAAARRFAVSPSAAIKLMQRVRATGSAAPARFGGHRRPLLAPFEADLRRWWRRRPISPWSSCRRHCSSAAGCAPGLSTLHQALRRIGLRHKKSPESGRAGSPQRCHQAPALARLAALHGPGALRLSR